jgi:hypothetical protein
MPRTKLINGVRYNLTVEEEAQRDAEELEFNNNGAFEEAMENLRNIRNSKLAETDYLALSDQTLSADMNTYRQQLRDITNGLTTVEEINAVVFPTKP